MKRFLFSWLAALQLYQLIYKTFAQIKVPRAGYNNFATNKPDSEPIAAPKEYTIRSLKVPKTIRLTFQLQTILIKNAAIKTPK